MLSIFVGGPKHVYFQYSKKNTQQIMSLKIKKPSLHSKHAFCLMINQGSHTLPKLVSAYKKGLQCNTNNNSSKSFVFSQHLSYWNHLTSGRPCFLDRDQMNHSLFHGLFRTSSDTVMKARCCARCFGGIWCHETSSRPILFLDDYQSALCKKKLKLFVLFSQALQ